MDRYLERREREGECERENIKGFLTKSRHQGLNGKRRLVQNSILNTVLTVTAVCICVYKIFIISNIISNRVMNKSV